MSTAKMQIPARRSDGEGAGMARVLSAINVEASVILMLVVLLVAASALTTGNFLSVANIRAILVATASTGIAAIGLTFVTLSGNFFSLSAGATAAASGVVFAELQSHGWASGPAVIAMLLIAIMIGAVQGVVVMKGANPIIVTLAAAAVLTGLSGVVDGDKGITVGQTSLNWFGSSRILSFPVVIYAFILITILASAFLSWHRDGRSLMLIGSKRQAAEATGLSFARATIIAFVVASVCCAIVALQSVLQFHYAAGTSFDSITLDALSAVLVGGAALQGGEGSPTGTALGALFIAILADFMVLHNYAYGVRLTVQGVVVVLAVTAFHLLRRARGSR